MQNVVLLFITSIITIGICYWLGFAILKFNKRKPNGFYFSSFCHLLTGIFFMITAMALYTCSGKTIFSIVLPVLILGNYFIHNNYEKEKTKIKISNETTFSRSILLQFFFVFLLLFFWCAWQLMDGNFAFGISANPENILYAQFSKIISHNGIESTLNIGMNFAPNTQYQSPYHYSDLWFTAVISQIFNTSHILALQCIVLPIFYFTAYLGIASCFEHFKIKTIQPLWSLLFMAIASCSFFPHAQDFTNYHFDDLEPIVGMYGEKLCLGFSLILLVYLLYLKSMQKASILFLLLTALLYPSLLTGIFIGVFVYHLILYLQKEIDLKDFLRIALLQFLLVFCFAIFYKNLNNSVLDLEEITDYSHNNPTPIKMMLAEIFYRIWDKPFRTLLIYLPFIALIVASVYRQKIDKPLKQITWMSCCIYLSAILVYSVIYKIQESWQLYTNTLLFLHVCIVLFSIQFLFLKSSFSHIALRFALLILLLGSWINSFQNYLEAKKEFSYSIDFREKVRQLTSKEKGKYLVAFLKNHQDIRTQTELITGGATAAYLQMDPHFLSLVSISPQPISEWKKYKKSTRKILLSQAYFRYLEEQKNGVKHLSEEENQFVFLKSNHIRYLAVSGNTKVPEKIENICKIKIVDPISGEKFLVLKTL